MSYRIKEAFYSLQGEGFHSGRPAIFCRFSHCNLWTGKEEDRATAICQFCDTDFIGEDGQNGGKFHTAETLAQHLLKLWPQDSNIPPFIVLTGGEPLLQVDDQLVTTFHDHHFEIAVETNGTLPAPKGIDWICVSPKANAPLIQDSGNELKLVYPQPEQSPRTLQNLKFDHFYLQPMSDSDPITSEQNRQKTLDYCLKNPKWNLSLQTHKILNID